MKLFHLNHPVVNTSAPVGHTVTLLLQQVKNRLVKADVRPPAVEKEHRALFAGQIDVMCGKSLDPGLQNRSPRNQSRYFIIITRRGWRNKRFFDGRVAAGGHTCTCQMRSSDRISTSFLVVASASFSPFSRVAAQLLPMTPLRVWASILWKVCSTPWSSHGVQPPS